jgi:sulfate/thiosulfate transport system substrate-binding protein
MFKRTAALAVSLLAATLGLSACGSSSSGSGSGGSSHLTIVAYSTPQGVFEKLIPAFQATAAGKGVTFSQSYGPSGEQSRAVANGLHDDVVNFSLEPDVERLVKAGMVSPTWNQNATHGFVTDSVAVIIVRKGNPKHITSWADLVKPGVQVLTPNPFTSGSARWNVMAAYGAQIKEGKTPAQAVEYLKALFHNVVSQDSSARNALQTFLAGRGDALIDYEDEAIADEKKGAAIEYVQIVRGIPALPRRTGDLGTEGISPGDLRRARRIEVPRPKRPVHDRNARRLEEGLEGVLRTGNGDRLEDRAVARCLHCQIATQPR